MTDLVVRTASRRQDIQRRAADGVDRLFGDIADEHQGRSGIADV
ncbi:hypothetical protein ABZ942_10030 [Nocardia sp. NPDC046473]